MKATKMIVKFHGESDPIFFVDGKDYEVLSVEAGMYRIVDETGEDYLYGTENFEIISGSLDEYVDEFAD